MSAPTLIYFPFGGRGELSRLAAAAGGVELAESAENDGSFFGALPILKHGDLELCQSQAITSYIASIGPKFADLTAAQKGVDAMYAGILEDVLSGCASVVFGDHSTAAETVPAHLDKFFAVIEGMLPASGFVNGLGFPTVADCAVLCMTDMMVPIGIAMQLAGGYDLARYPKMTALSSSTKSSPEVAAYLTRSATLSAVPKM